MATPSFPQAAHTLTLIDQQNPTDDDIRWLHDGYLTDLVAAIRLRIIPNRRAFRKAIGFEDLPTWRKVRLDGPPLESQFQSISSAEKQVALKPYLHERSQVWGELAMLKSFPQRHTNLVATTLKDLGLECGASREDVARVAEKFGCKLCEREAGPRLFVNHRHELDSNYVFLSDPLNRGVFWISRGVLNFERTNVEAVLGLEGMLIVLKKAD